MLDAPVILFSLNIVSKTGRTTEVGHNAHLKVKATVIGRAKAITLYIMR